MQIELDAAQLRGREEHRDEASLGQRLHSLGQLLTGSRARDRAGRPGAGASPWRQTQAQGQQREKRKAMLQSEASTSCSAGRRSHTRKRARIRTPRKASRRRRGPAGPPRPERRPRPATGRSAPAGVATVSRKSHSSPATWRPNRRGPSNCRLSATTGIRSSPGARSRRDGGQPRQASALTSPASGAPLQQQPQPDHEQDAGLGQHRQEAPRLRAPRERTGTGPGWCSRRGMSWPNGPRRRPARARRGYRRTPASG